MSIQLQLPRHRPLNPLTHLSPPQTQKEGGTISLTPGLLQRPPVPFCNRIDTWHPVSLSIEIERAGLGQQQREAGGPRTRLIAKDRMIAPEARPKTATMAITSEARNGYEPVFHQAPIRAPGFHPPHSDGELW